MLAAVFVAAFLLSRPSDGQSLEAEGVVRVQAPSERSLALSEPDAIGDLPELVVEVEEAPATGGDTPDPGTVVEPPSDSGETYEPDPYIPPSEPPVPPSDPVTPEPEGPTSGDLGN